VRLNPRRLACHIQGGLDLPPLELLGSRLLFASVSSAKTMNIAGSPAGYLRWAEHESRLLDKDGVGESSTSPLSVAKAASGSGAHAVQKGLLGSPRRNGIVLDDANVRSILSMRAACESRQAWCCSRSPSPDRYHACGNPMPSPRPASYPEDLG
jgi:hypothetical protein